MKCQFRPYTNMQPIQVILTGKVYEIGEHPYYKEHKILEVVDDEGRVHDAFEDELTFNIIKDVSVYGAKWQQKQDKNKFSEEDMLLAFETGRNFQLTGENNFKELIEQLKK